MISSTCNSIQITFDATPDCSKVLLINSPRELISSDPKLLHDNKMPLGVLYIMAFLRQKRIKVHLLDAEGLGLGISDILKTIIQKKYDWIALNCFSVNRYVVYEICKIIKILDPSIKIVIGGPQPTLAPSQTMEECNFIDYVVIGEGEITMYELVSQVKILSEIQGIGYRSKNTIIINKRRHRIENIDKLPFPIPDDYLLNKYTQHIDTSESKLYNKAFMLASRGCPYSCTYCASPRIWHRDLTHRSAENVLQEVQLYLDMGINRIHFYDDNFTLWTGLHRFCDLIQESGIMFNWGCSARVETLSEELAQKMSKCGCWAIAFGLESGSEQTLRKIGKINPNRSISRVNNMVKICSEIGIEPRAHFMVGFPWESLDDIESTLAFALSLKDIGLSDANFLVVKPYLGTELQKTYCQNDSGSNLLSQSQFIQDWTDESDPKVAVKLRRFNEIPVKSMHPLFDVWDLRTIVRNMYRIFKHCRFSDNWRDLLWDGVSTKS